MNAKTELKKGNIKNIPNELTQQQRIFLEWVGDYLEEFEYEYDDERIYCDTLDLSGKDLVHVDDFIYILI